MNRYEPDRNPTHRRATFPGRADQWMHLDGQMVDLPMRDAQHRPWRGKVVEVAQTLVPGVVRVTAELILQ